MGAASGRGVARLDGTEQGTDDPPRVGTSAAAGSRGGCGADRRGRVVGCGYPRLVLRTRWPAGNRDAIHATTLGASHPRHDRAPGNYGLWVVSTGSLPLRPVGVAVTVTVTGTNVAGVAVTVTATVANVTVRTVVAVNVTGRAVAVTVVNGVTVLAVNVNVLAGAVTVVNGTVSPSPTLPSLLLPSALRPLPSLHWCPSWVPATIRGQLVSIWRQLLMRFHGCDLM